MSKIYSLLFGYFIACLITAAFVMISYPYIGALVWLPVLYVGVSMLIVSYTLSEDTTLELPWQEVVVVVSTRLIGLQSILWRKSSPMWKTIKAKWMIYRYNVLMKQHRASKQAATMYEDAFVEASLFLASISDDLNNASYLEHAHHALIMSQLASQQLNKCNNLLDKMYAILDRLEELKES